MFKPTFVFNSVLEIDKEFLDKNNIKGLILDLDNTLTTHNNHMPADGILDWIAKMKQDGIKLMIVSNNNEQRVAPFAKKLGLDFVPSGAKPFSGGFRRASERLCLPLTELAIVGDQIFTDILGANMAKTRSIFVFPFQPEESIFFKIKRAIEKPLLPDRPKRKEV